MSQDKVPALKLNDYLSKDKEVRAQFVKDLYNSFKDYGFVVLTNHTIKPELLNRAYAVQEKLFDLPLEVKKQHFLNNGGQRGYTFFGTENAKNTKLSDLKEFWHVGRESAIANTWPKELPEFQPIMEELISHLDKTGDIILEALEESLGCKPGYFKGIVKDGLSVLRLLHYPTVPENLSKNGNLRSFEHFDIDLLTLLVSAQGGGLEILKNGEWIAIESDPEFIICPAGDMLERMCNFNLPSTMHRVTNPDPSKNVSRYSIPYFIHPRPEVMLDLLPKYANETPKLPIISSGDFLNERLKEIGLKK